MLDPVLMDDSADGAEIPKEETMSDEQRKDEDVEGHVRSGRIAEEPADDHEHEEDEVEAHVRKLNVRHDNVRHA
jgi:hypothetical protein